MLQRQLVQKLIGDSAETPAAANRLLRMIHILMRHAIEAGWRRYDPTLGVRKVRETSTGFRTWEEEHIDQFLSVHKSGTRAHLAMSLLLYAGQRRSDVVRMGRQHIRNNVLTIVQRKTGQEVGIPMHFDLKALVDSMPKDNLTFIVGEQGKPLTPESLTNWFRRMVIEAGLPNGLSAHGLRKATCRRLAEAGCRAHEIMAISGHKTLAEVTRYTVAANRKQAERAIASLDGTKTRTKVSNRARWFDNSPRKALILLDRKWKWWWSQSRPYRALVVKFPANRENNREFEKFWASGGIERPSFLGFVSGLRANSLSKRTGKFGPVNREFYPPSRENGLAFRRIALINRFNALGPPGRSSASPEINGENGSNAPKRSSATTPLTSTCTPEPLQLCDTHLMIHFVAESVR